MFLQLFFFFAMSNSAAASPGINDETISARVRREDRWVGAEQLAAVSSDGRTAPQRWIANVVGAEIPSGGKNKARKKAKLGPFYAATKIDAETKRAAALDSGGTAHDSAAGARIVNHEGATHRPSSRTGAACAQANC